MTVQKAERSLVLGFLLAASSLLTACNPVLNINRGKITLSVDPSADVVLQLEEVLVNRASHDVVVGVDLRGVSPVPIVQSIQASGASVLITVRVDAQGTKGHFNTSGLECVGSWRQAVDLLWEGTYPAAYRPTRMFNYTVEVTPDNPHRVHLLVMAPNSASGLTLHYKPPGK